MAEITEAQARWVCAELIVDPDTPQVRQAEDWPADEPAVGRPGHVLIPNWRIVQRAAAEGGEKP